MADTKMRDELLRDAPEMSFEEFHGLLRRVDPEAEKAGMAAVRSMYDQRVKGAKEEANAAKQHLAKTTQFVQNSMANDTPAPSMMERIGNALPALPGPLQSYADRVNQGQAKMGGPGFLDVPKAVLPTTPVDQALVAVGGPVGKPALTAAKRLGQAAVRTAMATGGAAAAETMDKGRPGLQTLLSGLGQGAGEAATAAVGPIARHIPGLRRMIQDREAQRLAQSLHEAAPAAVQPIQQRKGALGELMSARADDVAQQGISSRLEAQLSNLQAQVPQGSGMFSPTLLREYQALVQAAKNGDEVAMRLVPVVQPDRYGQFTVQQAQEMMASLRDRYVGKVTNPAMADRADRQAAQVVASVIDEMKRFAGMAAGRPVPQAVAGGLEAARGEYGVGKAVRELLQGSKPLESTGHGPGIAQAKLMEELVNNAPKYVAQWGRATYDQVVDAVSRGAGAGFKDTATKGVWARVPIIGEAVSHGRHVGAGKRYVGEPPLNVSASGRQATGATTGRALRDLLGAKESEK